MNKLRLLWHVLWGKPLIYRCGFVQGTATLNFLPTPENVWLVEASIDGEAIAFHAFPTWRAEGGIPR